MSSNTRKIAVFADVHGNVPALDAVLADLERQRPDEVLVGGDLVGRGPQGSAVVGRVKAAGWRGVRGNHEDYLLAFRREEVPVAWLQQDEWAASRWMAAELDDEDVAYIDALPLEIASALAPRVRLVHGSPASNNEGIGPWTSDRSLERHLDAVDGDLLVCAHTHRPMDRRVANGRVVNVGAVGLPFNHDRRAQYAILHVADGACDVELRRIEYPLEDTLRIYRESGFDAEGGLTARLLRMELEHAAPFLVPFTKWAEVQRRPIVEGELAEFLEFYDPTEPLRKFIERLAALD
ncbi:MAG: metallophosphoesterase family protein [Gemmatimonadota bacterium]|jgi:predicted phosphodiesterase